MSVRATCSNPGQAREPDVFIGLHHLILEQVNFSLNTARLTVAFALLCCFVPRLETTGLVMIGGRADREEQAGHLKSEGFVVLMWHQGSCHTGSYSFRGHWALFLSVMFSGTLQAAG